MAVIGVISSDYCHLSQIPFPLIVMSMQIERMSHLNGLAFFHSAAATRAHQSGPGTPLWNGLAYGRIQKEAVVTVEGALAK